MPVLLLRSSASPAGWVRRARKIAGSPLKVVSLVNIGLLATDTPAVFSLSGSVSGGKPPYSYDSEAAIGNVSLEGSDLVIAGQDYEASGSYRVTDSEGVTRLIAVNVTVSGVDGPSFGPLPEIVMTRGANIDPVDLWQFTDAETGAIAAEEALDRLSVVDGSLFIGNAGTAFAEATEITDNTNALVEAIGAGSSVGSSWSGVPDDYAVNNGLAIAAVVATPKVDGTVVQPAEAAMEGDEITVDVAVTASEPAAGSRWPEAGGPAPTRVQALTPLSGFLCPRAALP